MEFWFDMSLFLLSHLHSAQWKLLRVFFLVCVQKWELTSKISSITHNKRTNHLKIEFCAGAIKIITQKATKNDVWKNNSNRNKNKNWWLFIRWFWVSHDIYVWKGEKTKHTHTFFSRFIIIVRQEQSLDCRHFNMASNSFSQTNARQPT